MLYGLAAVNNKLLKQSAAVGKHHHSVEPAVEKLRNLSSDIIFYKRFVFPPGKGIYWPTPPKNFSKNP